MEWIGPLWVGLGIYLSRGTRFDMIQVYHPKLSHLAGSMSIRVSGFTGSLS